jgi:hypothetical protein
VIDAFHHLLVHNAGVPRVWPGMAFDVTAAALVAWVLLARARGTGRPQGLGRR